MYSRSSTNGHLSTWRPRFYLGGQFILSLLWFLTCLTLKWPTCTTAMAHKTHPNCQDNLDNGQLINWRTVHTRLSFTVKGDETWSIPLVAGLVYFHCVTCLYAVRSTFFRSIEMLDSRRNRSVILHTYLPVTASPYLQPSLSLVPKMAVVERFDCIYILFCYIHSFVN